jgi:tetratricopeptide (TPR) repeat protein
LKRDADHLDVQAQLIDGETGTAVWSDEFVYPQDSSNRADRLVAARLTAALRLELLRLEAQRALQRPPQSRDATDLAAIGYAVIYGPGYSDRGRMKEAGENLAKALQLDPNNVLAITARADWLMYELEYLPPQERAPLKAEALALARRAVTVAPNDGESWSSYATALELTNEMQAALEAIDRSLKLDPSNANSSLYRGRLLMLQGRFDEAVDQVRAAAALAPQVQDVIGAAALVECQALYFKRDYLRATQACERATGLGVDGYVTSMLQAALYAQAGQAARAQQAKTRALAEYPELRLNAFFADRLDGPIGDRYREWSEQLAKVGFPE